MSRIKIAFNKSPPLDEIYMKSLFLPKSFYKNNLYRVCSQSPLRLIPVETKPKPFFILYTMSNEPLNIKGKQAPSNTMSTCGVYITSPSLQNIHVNIAFKSFIVEIKFPNPYSNSLSFVNCSSLYSPPNAQMRLFSYRH